MKLFSIFLAGCLWASISFAEEQPVFSCGKNKVPTIDEIVNSEGFKREIARVIDSRTKIVVTLRDIPESAGHGHEGDNVIYWIPMLLGPGMKQLLMDGYELRYWWNAPRYPDEEWDLNPINISTPDGAQIKLGLAVLDQRVCEGDSLLSPKMHIKAFFDYQEKSYDLDFIYSIDKELATFNLDGIVSRLVETFQLSGSGHVV